MRSVFGRFRTILEYGCGPEQRQKGGRQLISNSRWLVSLTFECIDAGTISISAFADMAIQGSWPDRATACGQLIERSIRNHGLPKSAASGNAEITVNLIS